MSAAEADKEERREAEREEGDGLRFVAVSNRLPVTISREKQGWVRGRGEGGLVTALSPALRNRGGLWIGWPGTTEEGDLTEVMEEASQEEGYRLHPVRLSPREVEDFYYGFSNQVLWPFFHDMVSRCNFDPQYWYAYLSVNHRFASEIVGHSREWDYIWVHDYHLMCVARELRALGSTRRVGFYLHIPFPPLDIFLKLPWRGQILNALLDFDLVGFQSIRDRRNFLHCVKRLIPGVRTRGQGTVVTAERGDKEVKVGSFPISIDYREFADAAGSEEASEKARELKEKLGGRRMILGVDRLDYTKGITERLQAFDHALQEYQELRGNVTFVLISVPSRENVPDYQALHSDIERMVGEINGRFTEPGWVPIHYLYRSLGREELIAHYLAADMALVTPLKDGMNLVAKEYCACQVENDGILILSEFAGAAAQLHRWALMVNPHDQEGVAEAIYRAYTMSEEEKRERMRRARVSIRRNSIYRWVDSYLGAALDIKLDDVPYQEDYVPPLEG